MDERRFSLAALIATMVATAAIVIAAMALVGPRLSRQVAKVSDALASPTLAPPTVAAVTPEPPTTAPTATRPAPSPTPTRRPTATRTPTPTQTSTPSPTPMPDAVVTVETLNLRSGPGTIYDRVGALRRGDALTVTARNQPGDWLSVIAPDGGRGWVATSLVQLNIPLGEIPVAINIPTPPVSPTPKPTATPRPTLTVDEQIAALGRGEHGQLPQPGASGPVAAGGDVELTILNDTPYQLTVLIGSPNGTAVVVEPCSTCRVYRGAGPLACQDAGRPRQVVRIKPGTMQVAARVSDPDVIPFLGTWTLDGDTGYLDCFFIVTVSR